MYYHEERMNLFDVPQGWWIAHCISADFALGAGVAKQIEEVFHIRERLAEEYDNMIHELGNCCLVCGNVLNLITKRHYWGKPTLDSMKEALDDMCTTVGEYHIRKVAMPRIGCGLDKLKWEDVSQMIQDVFKNIDIEIMVCYL